MHPSIRSTLLGAASILTVSALCTGAALASTADSSDRFTLAAAASASATTDSLSRRTAGGPQTGAPQTGAPQTGAPRTGIPRATRPPRLKDIRTVDPRSVTTELDTLCPRRKYIDVAGYGDLDRDGVTEAVYTGWCGLPGGDGKPRPTGLHVIEPTSTGARVAAPIFLLSSPPADAIDAGYLGRTTVDGDTIRIDGYAVEDRLAADSTRYVATWGYDG